MNALFFPILTRNALESPYSINQTDFFSNRNISKQLSSLREFNETQITFLNKYQNKQNIKPKCGLYKKNDINLRDISIQTPQNINEELSLLEMNMNQRNNKNKKSKRVIESKNQRPSEWNKRIKSETFNIENERNSNIQLYQSIFKINEERKREKKATINTKISNKNKDNKMILPNQIDRFHLKKYDHNKYSKDTKNEMKEAKEKLSFLKGVFNYVFPKYLKFKIEPYAINKRETQPMLPKGLSQTFYGSKQWTEPARTMSKFTPTIKDSNNTSERRNCFVNEISL